MKVDDSYSRYMYDFIDTICTKFGPRYSGSKAESDANEWIKNEFDIFSDETFIDEFETRPAMYPQGLIKVAGIFGGLSPLFMPFIFPIPIFSLIFVLIGLWVLYSELMLMKEWIRPFFKKKTSSNVFGIIKPTGETKYRIIFEGHTDSAKEMNIASYSPKKRKIVAILGIYFLIHTIIFSAWKFTAQIFGLILIFFELGIFSFTLIDAIYFTSIIVLYPFFILVLKGFLGKTVVLGANDNLAGSAVSAAIGKYLSQNRPKNVEIWFGSQGSEEVGDKGAKAFVEKYGELGILDNCYTVVLECCGAAGDMVIIEKDMHRAFYNVEVNELLKDAHKMAKKTNPDMLGLRTTSLKIGSCDACRYIHEGYKAAALMGTEYQKNKAVNWHSVKDAPETMDEKVLKDFLEVCLEFVKIVDENLDSIEQG